MSEAAAFAAWLGGGVILLADARRGLALGLVVVTASLAMLVYFTGEGFGAVALAVGGAAAAILRLRTGPPGWGLMQAGSTPRIILAIVIGIAALYVAVTLSSGDGAPLRFALLAVIGLATARVIEGPGPSIALTGAASLALAIGAAPAAAGLASAPATAIVAAIVAIGASALPEPATRGA